MTKTKPRTTLNVKLLRRIQRAIRKEPKRIDMERWAGDTAFDPPRRLPPCQTVGCIAGWALAVDRKGKNRLKEFKVDEAVRALGLTSYNSIWLFYTHAWPTAWRDELNKHIVGTKAYAQVVFDYIDYFIEQNEEKETA